MIGGKKVVATTYRYNPKLVKIWKRLPRVPMTQYLETSKLNTDIMYSGYRPVIYPVKENPLFRHKKNQQSIMNYFIDENSVNEERNPDDNNDGTENRIEVNKYLFGENNQGGIETLGLNGTWKYGPRVPSNLLPFNWWSVSSLGMEWYPEWNGVPREVIAKLKPFDRG